jgi:hypothetical protein
MVITFRTMCQRIVALGTLKGLKHTAARCLDGQDSVPTARLRFCLVYVAVSV